MINVFLLKLLGKHHNNFLENVAVEVLDWYMDCRSIANTLCTVNKRIYIDIQELPIFSQHVTLRSLIFYPFNDLLARRNLSLRKRVFEKLAVGVIA